ncbi:MAG: hypothetical protein JHC95_12280 [Solirubrobacteraceae bacterium]|nr:hypothetical protein [Solirubrobacteraceae bacterium]
MAERLVAAAIQVSASILAGDLTPYEGARKIAALCRAENIHPPEELHTFVYADSEWNDRPKDGNIFAEGVIAAARKMTRTAEVYVELLEESVEVFRPVDAAPQGNDIYVLPSDAPPGEAWRFPPGSRVRCELRPLEGRPRLVAIEVVA